MRICVLVKEVPDPAAGRRIDEASGRLDRDGEKILNPFDAHALEAAMQVRESGLVDVSEIVAITMGPGSASRALQRALALGADRGVHLTDDALVGSDVGATGYALARLVANEDPDLVLLGQQSDDGECYAVGSALAEHLRLPALTQVIKMEVEADSLMCERQAEYGYDTVRVALPAVVSVGDAINQPRYASLKAIMGATKKPLERTSAADAGVEAQRVGVAGSRTEVLSIGRPSAKPAGEMFDSEDADAAVEKIVGWLQERELLD